MRYVPFNLHGLLTCTAVYAISKMTDTIFKTQKYVRQLLRIHNMHLSERCVFRLPATSPRLEEGRQIITLRMGYSTTWEVSGAHLRFRLTQFPLINARVQSISDFFLCLGEYLVDVGGWSKTFQSPSKVHCVLMKCRSEPEPSRTGDQVTRRWQNTLILLSGAKTLRGMSADSLKRIYKEFHWVLKFSPAFSISPGRMNARLGHRQTYNGSILRRRPSCPLVLQVHGRQRSRTRK